MVTYGMPSLERATSTTTSQPPTPVQYTGRRDGPVCEGGGGSIECLWCHTQDSGTGHKQDWCGTPCQLLTRHDGRRLRRC